MGIWATVKRWLAISDAGSNAEPVVNSTGYDWLGTVDTPNDTSYRTMSKGCRHGR